LLQILGNKIYAILGNYLILEGKEIFDSKFEIIFVKGNQRRIIISRGVNNIIKNEISISGGWHMITIKFFESRLL
jgi:hypothetical protein